MGAPSGVSGRREEPGVRWWLVHAPVHEGVVVDMALLPLGALGALRQDGQKDPRWQRDALRRSLRIQAAAPRAEGSKAV